LFRQITGRGLCYKIGRHYIELGKTRKIFCKTYGYLVVTGLHYFSYNFSDKVMKIPHLDRILKTECYHRETEMKYRHYEFATYMENIISWLDLK